MSLEIGLYVQKNFLVKRVFINIIGGMLGRALSIVHLVINRRMFETRLHS